MANLCPCPSLPCLEPPVQGCVTTGIRSGISQLIFLNNSVAEPDATEILQTGYPDPIPDPYVPTDPTTYWWFDQIYLGYVKISPPVMGDIAAPSDVASDFLTCAPPKSVRRTVTLNIQSIEFGATYNAMEWWSKIESMSRCLKIGWFNCDGVFFGFHDNWTLTQLGIVSGNDPNGVDAKISMVITISLEVDRATGVITPMSPYPFANLQTLFNAFVNWDCATQAIITPGALPPITPGDIEG